MPVIIGSLAVVIVVCIGVAIGVLFAVGGPSQLIGKPTTVVQEEVADEGPADEMAQAETQPEEQVAPEPQADPRDAEFAVDPARTAWNFEPTPDRRVYLTFDDGPSENTPAVLDILDAYGIKATFFVTGINPDWFGYIGDA